MEDIKENWLTIKETIRREYNISDISYQTWVAPLEFYNIVDDVVNIIIPSDQARKTSRNKRKRYFSGKSCLQYKLRKCKSES